MARAYMSTPICQQVQVSEMYTFFVQKFQHGYRFRGESHAFWECVYVLQGQICVSADERIFHVSAGEIVFHKPLEFHRFHVIDPSGALLLIFSFSADGALMEQLQNKACALTVNQKDIVQSLLRFADENAIDDQTDNRRFMRALDRLPRYSHVVALHLEQLFLSLTETSEFTPVLMEPDAMIFQKAVKYLSANLHRSVKIEELSQICNISRSGVQRIFNKYAGIGAHKYFLNLKLCMATQLLKNHESVTAVADKLGFFSQSHFSSTYKRETGMNPSEVK